jgi:hypothetical protein
MKKKRENLNYLVIDSISNSQYYPIHNIIQFKQSHKPQKH